MIGRLRVRFVTPLLVAEGAPGQTGGTLSNLHLLRAMAAYADVRVLTLQSALPHGAFDAEPFAVTHAPAPTWRGAELVARWVPFVRACTCRFLADHGGADVIVATTSTLAALEEGGSARRVAIVQAYENFGVRVPSGIGLQTRRDLAKGALVHRGADGRHLRAADAVVVTSRFMAEAVTARFDLRPQQTFRVPQVADMPAVAPLGETPAPLVGFVHRGADKGLAFVLRLAAAAPDVTFRIHGHTSGLSGDMPANVQAMGWVEDRGEMFAGASVWIVPSTWPEPFGRVAMEARCAGRGVLVSNRGGLPEAAGDADAVVAEFDVATWVERIRAALRVPGPVRSAQAERARATWSTEAHAHATHALLRALSRDASEHGEVP